MTVFAHAPFLDCGLTTVDFGPNHMSKIQKYEGIRAWQKVRELTKGIVNPSCFDQLYSPADEVGRRLAGFMAYLKQSDLRGKKFK